MNDPDLMLVLRINKSILVVEILEMGNKDLNQVDLGPVILEGLIRFLFRFFSGSDPNFLEARI